MTYQEAQMARNDIAVIQATSIPVMRRDIHAATGISTDTVTRVLRRLVAAGVVSRLPKFHYKISDV